MGSYLEINDTLQLTTEQAFPEKLNLEKHRKNTITLADVEGKIFKFANKPNARIYHRPPVRNFLVHNINGKWLHWGKALVIEQTISGEKTPTTSGKFKIIEIYDPKLQEEITKRESPKGLSFF